MLTLSICRDPWWVFTTINLFWNIKYRYEFAFLELIRISPRFVVMLLSMCTSLIFTLVDILSVTNVINLASGDGINPFWKLAFVFKCLTDTIVLDDFKTALDRLHHYKLDRIRGAVGGTTFASHGNGSSSATGPYQTDNLARTVSGGDASSETWLEMLPRHTVISGHDYDEQALGVSFPKAIWWGGVHVRIHMQVSSTDVENVATSGTSTGEILGG